MILKKLGRKAALAGLLAMSVAIGAAGGATVFNAALIYAQSPTTQAATPNASQSPSIPMGGPSDPSKGGHVGTNGVKEELLTGDTAEKVRSAALAAVPGGTIQRVETDAEGAVYEAHMTKPDGSRVTVKLDGSFKVTSTEDGNR